MRPAQEQTRHSAPPERENQTARLAARAHTAGSSAAPAASQFSYPGAEEGVYKEEHTATERTWPGNPQVPPPPPSSLGKPELGSPLSCSGRLANPSTAFPQSARQPQTGSSLSLSERLANPLTALPQSVQSGSPLPYFGPAWQTRGSPAAAAAVVPGRRAAGHRGTYRLVPIDLPARPPPRAAKPWSRHEAPIDPRTHTPPPTPDPAVRGTCWDPCPDTSIEEILQVRMRLAPLLSPLKSPAPQRRPTHR